MSLYENKINKATAYILENLSSDLNWKDVSRYCAISEYHFHRIFTAFMNETPREFIIRKRLEKAMAVIAYRTEQTDLQNLAFECGYSSQSNFNKAFKGYFGVTPGQVEKKEVEIKSKIGKLKSRYGKDFQIRNLYPDGEINDGLLTNEVSMKAEIKEFPERKVIYRMSENGYKRESIQKLWTEFMTDLANIGNNVEAAAVFGVGHDNPQVTPEEKCRYDACVSPDSLTEVPKNEKEQTFPHGKYACFHYKGSGEKLLQFYLEIFKNWFVKNGYEPGDFPLIERYIHVDKDDPQADIELETQFLLK